MKNFIPIEIVIKFLYNLTRKRENMKNSKINILKEYQGLNLGKNLEVQVTEEEINQAVDYLLKNSKSTKVKNTASKIGDIVNIDFEGFVDGVAFEGGQAEKYDLELGSNSFIPGFEEQLIDLVAGDKVDVNVKFPEDYHAENLKGKEAVFKCLVHEVKEKVEPELNDEFAKSVGYNSKDELLQAVSQNLRFQKMEKAKDDYVRGLLDAIINTCEFSIDEEDVKAQVNNFMNYYSQTLAQQGLNLDQYLQMVNMTKEALEENFKGEATKAVKIDLVLEAIAKVENITASEEEINNEFEMMKKHYNLSDEQILSYKETRAEDMKNSIVSRKVVSFLVEKNN